MRASCKEGGALVWPRPSVDVTLWRSDNQTSFIEQVEKWDRENKEGKYGKEYLKGVLLKNEANNSKILSYLPKEMFELAQKNLSNTKKLGKMFLKWKRKNKDYCIFSLQDLKDIVRKAGCEVTYADAHKKEQNEA